MSEQEFILKLKEFNVELSDYQLSQFDKYLKFLQVYSEKINLTAITKKEEVYVMHFLDSLLPFMALEIKDGTICDVGAGAGFPSIPLKIAFPSIQVTIVEPLNKRCIFLKALVEELQLENVIVENVRAEDYVKEHRESYDYVSARAVANLNLLSELCIPLVKLDGLFIALKGSAGKEEMETAKNATDILGVKIIKILEEKVGEHTHINLVYKKIKKTPSKYPRFFAKMKKDPL